MYLLLNSTVRPLIHLVKGAVRTGVYVGVSFSAVFTAWLLIANRVLVPETLAVWRNVAATCLLGVIAAIPVVRYLRSPSEMVLSSMLAWGIFALTYGGLCLEFSQLNQYYSVSQIFVLGAVVYLLFATLAWVGTIVWRVRAAHSSHPRH